MKYEIIKDRYDRFVKGNESKYIEVLSKRKSNRDITIYLMKLEGEETFTKIAGTFSLSVNRVRDIIKEISQLTVHPKINREVNNVT